VLATDQRRLYMFLQGIPGLRRVADLDGVPTINGQPTVAAPSIVGNEGELA